MPDLAITALAKTYGDRRVLDEVSFAVPDGAFLTLLGPSGCGKTTTLMAVAGFTRPDTGLIRAGNRVLFDAAAKTNVAAEKRNLGVVFQSYALWPHLSVADNVAFPLKVRRADKKEIAAKVAQTLEVVELGHRAAAFPHELSGGQQQRVALARALAPGPSVLLLDEPFSNLDAKLRERARDWLKALQRDLGITTVFVTHDQTEALAMSDEIIVMNGGRIARAGTPEQVYRDPGDRFTAEFLGRCTFLSGTAAPAGGGAWRLVVDQLPASVPFRSDQQLTGRQVTVAIRPENIGLSAPTGEEPASGSLTAAVTAVSFLGEAYLYTLIAGPHTLTALSPQRFDRGPVTVTVAADAVSLIDEAPRAVETPATPAIPAAAAS